MFPAIHLRAVSQEVLMNYNNIHHNIFMNCSCVIKLQNTYTCMHVLAPVFVYVYIWPFTHAGMGCMMPFCVVSDLRRQRMNLCCISYAEYYPAAAWNDDMRWWTPVRNSSCEAKDPMNTLIVCIQCFMVAICRQRSRMYCVGLHDEINIYWFDKGNSRLVVEW